MTVEEAVVSRTTTRSKQALQRSIAWYLRQLSRLMSALSDEELEKVWAGQATAEQGLKAAKERSAAEIRKFAAANK